MGGGELLGNGKADVAAGGSARASTPQTLAIASLLLAGTTPLAACGGDDDQMAADMPMDAGGHGMDGHDVADSPVAEGGRHVPRLHHRRARRPRRRRPRRHHRRGVHAEEPGTYTYYCSVPGRCQAGVEGTLTVQ